MTKRIKLPVYFAIAALGLAVAFLATGTHQASGQTCTPPYCPAGGGGGGGSTPPTTTVTTPSQTVTAPNQNAGPGLEHNPHLSSTTGFVSPDGKTVVVDFTCPADAGSNCQGTGFLIANTVTTRSAHAAAMLTVAQGAYDIKPGVTDRVVLKMTPEGLRLVLARTSVPVAVAARITDTAGNVTNAALGTMTLKLGARPKPALSAGVTPKTDGTLPYRFATRGRLSVPKSVGRSVGCKSATVEVRYKVGKKTISTRRAKVTSTCTYKSTVRFTATKRLTAGTLKVLTRFTGNAALRPVSGPTRKVHVG